MISSIILFTFIITFIDVYAEIHIENYGTFRNRLFYLFSIKTLFIFFKFSCLFSSLYIILDIKSIDSIDMYVNETIKSISWEYWYLYLICPFSFFLTSSYLSFWESDYFLVFFQFSMEYIIY